MDQTRYKQRSAKFGSAQDARAVRAVANRVDRKAQRQRGILGRRNLNTSDVLDDSNLSFQSVPEKRAEPNKTYEEMQEELYQQLLIFKNEKKKRLEKEKHYRRPVFQTGGFIPDQPKFLVGIDSENFAPNKSQNDTQTTPFKFMRSTTRSGTTPGGSSATKVLKFRSGATPNMASKDFNSTAPYKSPGIAKKRILMESEARNISESNTSKFGNIKPSWKKNNNKSRAHSRMNAVTKAQIELEAAEDQLGVAALPLSPNNSVVFSKTAVNISKFVTSKSKKSFAPDDFKFGFKGLVAQIMAKARGIMEETENETEEDIRDIINQSYESVLEENEDDNCLLESSSNEDNKMDHLDGLVISSNVFDLVKENEMTSDINPETKASEITASDSEEYVENSNYNDHMKPEEADEKSGVKELVESATVNETNNHSLSEAEIDNDNVFMPNEVTNVCEDSLEMMEVDEENVNTPSLNNKLNGFSARRSRRISVSSCEKSGRHSRLMKSCCDTSSPMSRLRPRTPCSRSTRRSNAAHTDHPLNLSFTPGRRSSAKRSIRRSLARSLKNEERASASPVRLYASPSLGEAKKTLVEDNKPCQEDESIIKLQAITEKLDSPQEAVVNTITHKQYSSQPKDTPTNDDNKTDAIQYTTPSGDITGSVSQRKRGGRVSWMVECSPYITTSRGSSKKERRSISRLNADLTGLFDDIPTDGSPLPDYLMKSAGPAGIIATGDLSALPDSGNAMSPAVKTVSDDICTNLLSLLQPTSPEKLYQSPEVNVWGEDTPTGTPLKLSPSGDATETLAAEIPNVSESLPYDLPEDDCENIVQSSMHQKQKVNNRLSMLQKSGRRKSRRSVMFTEDSSNTENCGIRYPGTPIRSTTRVSMGLFSAVDVNTTDPNVSPTQNFLVFDSPKSERKNRGTRRSSVRMSLLPVVETPLAGDNTKGRRCSQITEDLISWDSPNINKRMSRGADLATPRRSRRLSKAIIE